MPVRVGLAAALLVGAGLAFPAADLIETNVYLVTEDQTGTDDAYVVAQLGRIEGRVAGDVTIAVGGDLTISGTVDGDVNVLSGGTVEVTESGRVGGSLRGAARSVVVAGAVDGDVAVAAMRIEVTGEVRRDLVGLGGSLVVAGAVGHDVNGWFVDGELNGDITNGVDVRVRTLSVGAETTVGGDLLYRADRDADVADGVDPGGSFARLSTRAPFTVRVTLAVLTVLGLVTFLLLGLIVIWVSRDTLPRAAGAIITRPWAVLAWGAGIVVGGPLLVWALVTMIPSFVAKVVTVALIGLLVLVVIVFGPIPALVTAGDAVLGRRGGLFGGFVAGAVLWRLAAWLLPVAGFILSVGLLIWGVGGWADATWRRRSATPVSPGRRGDSVVVTAGR